MRRGGTDMDQERRDFLQDSARLGGFAVASAALWRIEPVLAQGGPGHELATMTIVELSQLLASQKITSRQLVEQALAAIKDPQGEGARTFLSVHESEALAAADKVDAQRRAGAKLPTLAGIPISIKDLFDEAGVTTLGGSKVLVGTPAATRDSSVIERLKKAGAVIIGRTNLVDSPIRALASTRTTAPRKMPLIAPQAASPVARRQVQRSRSPTAWRPARPIPADRSAFRPH
jgi:aspartyl-tRNA(Asn)/glutamyl-tRNA(Gln) amidotransferase subunit A